MTTARRTHRAHRVVFVGGGYVTLHAYAALVRRCRVAVIRGDLEIVVVSADDCHSFHGFTGEVLSRRLPLEVTRTDLRAAMPLATVLHGRVRSVDPSRQTVTWRPAGLPRREETLGYDDLVVAAGGREPTHAVPGLEEHGLTLREPGDIAGLLARVDEEAGADRPTKVVVVGGGLAGVELSSAIAERIGWSGDDSVTLVHSGAQILPRLQQPRLVQRARTELTRRGVRVRCGVRVVEVDATGVRLSDGAWLPATAVVATLGQRPVPIAGLETLPVDATGRLVTRCDLSVVPRVWAAGDIASVAHPRTGAPVPANALWAIKAGDHLGRNLARSVRGMATRPFAYRGLGQAAAFGSGRGIAELYGVPLTGGLAWTMRLGFFLRFMPSRRTAARTLGHFISRKPLPSNGFQATPAVAAALPTTRTVEPDGVLVTTT